MVVHTYRKLSHPKKQSQLFQLFLSTEKGYTSTLSKITNGWRVTASDGKSVDFLKN